MDRQKIEYMKATITELERLKKKAKKRIKEEEVKIQGFDFRISNKKNLIKYAEKR